MRKMGKRGKPARTNERDVLAGVVMLNDDGEPTTTSQLEDILDVAELPYERVVRGLIDAGLLRREFGDEGWRSRWTITEAGRAFLTQARAA